MTTSAQMVEVARSPMLDLLEQGEPRLSFKRKIGCFHSSSTFTSSLNVLLTSYFLKNSRVPVSPRALEAAAAELQESARIATGLSPASKSMIYHVDINC